MAVTMHVPNVTPVTMLPLTVQMFGVAEPKVTGRPELAVALTVPVPPTSTRGAGPKVMVCVAPTGIVSVNVAGSMGTPLVLTPAAAFAATAQSPAATPFTVLPLTVQMPAVVELNVTGSPRFDVAARVPLAPTANDAGNDENAMV